MMIRCKFIGKFCVMRRLYLYMLFTFVSFTLTAQNYAISGSVVDAGNNKEVLPFARLRVFERDTVPVATAVSEDDGSFMVKLKGEGDYLLSVSYLGYETLEKRFKLTKKNPKLRIGKLQLSPDSKMLREAVVTGLANELTIKSDTFVYNSSAYRIPEGATVAVLIKQLPGLSMDSDGNLTFQGKKVDNILVNGKPFFGDMKTAMSNMTTEAVDNVQIYKKSNEDSDFAGKHDTNKETVIDLKIKKEYMSSWNVNANLGGGTKERYLGKVFASNFSDKYRAAVFAQVNNISQDEQVDENGNWYHWGGGNGFYTYRKAGTVLSWDNGLKNNEGGYMRGNINVTLSHNNSNRNTISNTETFLSQGSHFGYNNSNNNGRERGVNTHGSLTWNIDTLNRVTFGFGYNYNDNNNSNNSKGSTYKCEQSITDAHSGLIGDNIDKLLYEQGVNSIYDVSGNTSRSINAIINANYTHRFGSSGNSIYLNALYLVSSNRNSSDLLSHYRYFSSDAPRPEYLMRRYTLSPGDNSAYGVSAGFSGRITDEIQYHFDYSYAHNKRSAINSLYDLNRYDAYNSSLLPHGTHPSTADSLRAVMDIANSYNSVEYSNKHSLGAGVSGRWEKFETHFKVNAAHKNEHLYYSRDNNHYTPTRKYVDWNVNYDIRLRPVKNGELNIFYQGSTSRPALVSLLPITDTSNEMVVSVNNPNLKTEWNNSINMAGNYFNEKRGDNYGMFGYFSWNYNTATSISQTDEATGKRMLTTKNVNGNYHTFLLLTTEQPLDTARHWTLRLSAHINHSHRKSFVGSMGDKLGLSVVNSYNPTARMSLKWRENIWSISLSSSYSKEITRYRHNKLYNQSGSVFEFNFQPQVELPFGLRINTSFGLFDRSGYDSDILNHSQWLWNATVSQSLLKSKALTLQLEAVDILHERTSEWSSLSAASRNFGRIETFHSYIMLSAIYRFYIGEGK